MSRDEIRLIMPRKRPYYGVAHLVLGGVASRLDLTVEHLEELPDAARRYVEYVERAIDVEVTMIGTGADRERVLTPRGLRAAVSVS